MCVFCGCLGVAITATSVVTITVRRPHKNITGHIIGMRYIEYPRLSGRCAIGKKSTRISVVLAYFDTGGTRYGLYDIR